MTDMQIPATFGPGNLPAGMLLVVRQAQSDGLQTAALRFFSAFGTSIPDHPGGTVVLYNAGVERGFAALAGDPEQERLFFVEEQDLIAHWPKQLP